MFTRKEGKWKFSRRASLPEVLQRTLVSKKSSGEETLALDLARLGMLKKMAFTSFPKPSILVGSELSSECRHRARGPPAAAGFPPTGEGAAHPRLQSAIREEARTTPWGATPRSLAPALTRAELRGSAGADSLTTGTRLRQGQHGDERLLAQLGFLLMMGGPRNDHWPS